MEEIIKKQHGNKGKKHKKESIELMSMRKKGKLSHRKGLTFEEEYGIERAKQIKLKQSMNHLNKKTWNTGLNKEIDERVRKMSENHKGKKSSEETKKLQSIIRKEKIKNGEIKVWNAGLKGEEYLRHFKNIDGLKLRKGKIFEEIYGVERAKEIREKNKKTWENSPFKNNRSKNISESMKNQHKLGLRKEVYKKIGNSNKGRKPTQEQIERIKKWSLEHPHGYWLGKRRLNMCGENNPAWNNGSHFLPYPPTFNNFFKKTIRERDNYTCLKCNISEIDAKELYKCKLNIHHIDYLKENTFKENCCCLCHRCNIEVNINREHWKKFFQSLVSERYGYKYAENGDIVININDGGIKK